MLWAVRCPACGETIDLRVSDRGFAVDHRGAPCVDFHVQVDAFVRGVEDAVREQSFAGGVGPRTN